MEEQGHEKTLEEIVGRDVMTTLECALSGYDKYLSEKIDDDRSLAASHALDSITKGSDEEREGSRIAALEIFHSVNTLTIVKNGFRRTMLLEFEHSARKVNDLNEQNKEGAK